MSSSMNIPSVSAVVADLIAFESVNAILDQLKNLSSAELFKVQKALTAQLEKSVKSGAAKPVKAAALKKAVANNGKQLEKPRKWVEYVRKHALQNGWESFEISQKKKKATGETIEETLHMPASECIDGVYYYKGLVDKTGKPKTIIPREAMTLSKVYWSNKDQVGRHPELYEEFEAQYVSAADSESESILSATESSIESSVESEDDDVPVAAAAAAVATAAPKKGRAPKKTESQKVADKAAKEATKAAAKALKAAAPKKATKAAAAAAAADNDEKEEPAAAVPKTKKKPVAKKAAKEWTCEDDGEFHSWKHDGVDYLRNFAGHVFKASENGEVDPEDWMGVWNTETLSFDAIEIPAEYTA